VLIVDPDAAFASVGQVLGRIEVGDGQDRGDVPVEAFRSCR